MRTSDSDGFAMSARKHIALLSQASAVWIVFWLIGLPDYFRQYSPVVMGVLCTLLSLAICLYALWVLLPRSPQRRVRLAYWLSFYYSVPFALYDWLYCGVYLGHGAGYPVIYWYLSVFYVSVWLTFLPVAFLLNRRPAREQAA
jgi:hypothetical protein